MADRPDRHAVPNPFEPAEAAIRTLLAARAAGATICPSEAARLIAGDERDWRGAMGEVHEAVDAMVRDGAIALCWKGKPLEVRGGPYRIALRK